MPSLVIPPLVALLLHVTAAGGGAQPQPGPPDPADAASPLPEEPSSKPADDHPPAAGRQWRDPRTGIVFALVPGGEFEMGSEAIANERPVHRVRLEEFWLATTEVTQAQWRTVMGLPPPKKGRCDECPVVEVSWEDVQGFLERTGYRLPTEAEWEYAAGGGAAHQRWAGTDDEEELGDFAWHRGNSGNQPHPVGRKKPNLFGLHDMSGNVYEWCADWYDPDYYGSSPAEDPRGPASGTYRVARGGSWILDPRLAGVTFRLKALPSRRRGYIGFRPVLPGGPGAPAPSAEHPP